MKYVKWQTLFWLHDHYAGLELPRNTGNRPETPEDGFLVIICQFDSKNNPFSQGAAVSAIRLYEAPDFETMKLDIHYPPANLPRRHLFFREEMSDGVVDNDPPAVSDPTDWFEHKAQLMHFLGMNTFSKDLLALPALPSSLVENASDDPEIVVRKIVTDESGTYIAVMNTGFADKLSQTIHIEDIPVKSIYNKPFKVSASASSGLDVTWRLLTGPATLDGDWVTITGPGWINLEARQDGNENYYPVSAKISVRVDTASVNDFIQKTEASLMNFYPNPSGNKVFVEIQDPVEFSIYSAAGNKLLELQLNSSQSVDISVLEPGLYILEAANKESRYMKKFIRTY